MPIETTMTIEVPAWQCNYCDQKFKKSNVALLDCLGHEREHPESKQVDELVGRYVEVTDNGTKRLGKVKKVFREGDLLISGSDTCPSYNTAPFDGFDVEYVYHPQAKEVVITGALVRAGKLELLKSCFNDDDVEQWHKDTLRTGQNTKIEISDPQFDR